MTLNKRAKVRSIGSSEYKNLKLKKKEKKRAEGSYIQEAITCPARGQGSAVCGAFNLTRRRTRKVKKVGKGVEGSSLRPPHLVN